MATKNLGQISGTSPADSTAASLGSIAGLEVFDLIEVVATVQGATGDTLDLYLQTSWDNGTTWYDWAHLTQLAAGAASATYSIQPDLTQTLVAIGSGSSPALAAGTVLGPWGGMMRVWQVPGGSTSAGAAQTFEFHGYQRHI